MTGLLCTMVGGDSGGGGDVLTLNTATVSASYGGPTSAKWRLASDGGVYYSRTNVSGGAFLWQYNWVEPTSSASLYECTWTAGTGIVDTPPGTAGTYLALTSSRDWVETQVASGDDSADFTARIRLVGGGSDLKTAVIELWAENTL